MADSRKKIATSDNVDRFSFNGIEQLVKVVKVVDGDTCDVVLAFHGELVKLRCRLEDIDCAEKERGSLDINGRDGWTGRDFLAHLCTGGRPDRFDDSRPRQNKDELKNKLNASQTLVHASFGDFDDFGRVLVTLKKARGSPKSFSKILEEYGYAKNEKE